MSRKKVCMYGYNEVVGWLVGLAFAGTEEALQNINISSLYYILILPESDHLCISTQIDSFCISFRP